MGWRSLLFVPGDNAARIEKAHERGADAIILDLEDSVAAAAKPEARAALPAAVSALYAKGATIVVRINSGWRQAMADLDKAVRPYVTAIMIPKVGDPKYVAVLGDIMNEFEAERGLPLGGIGVIALIESPAGLTASTKIVSVPSVIGLALGSEDFALALGVPPTQACLDLPSRQLALAAAERGLMALAVPFSIAAYKEEEAYRDAAVAARAFGATGALCIHPLQVGIANLVFDTTAAERAEARAIVLAWNEAQSQGNAVFFPQRQNDRPSRCGKGATHHESSVV